MYRHDDSSVTQALPQSLPRWDTRTMATTDPDRAVARSGEDDCALADERLVVRGGTNAQRRHDASPLCGRTGEERRDVRDGVDVRRDCEAVVKRLAVPKLKTKATHEGGEVAHRVLLGTHDVILCNPELRLHASRRNWQTDATRT